MRPSPRFPGPRCSAFSLAVAALLALSGPAAALPVAHTYLTTLRPLAASEVDRLEIRWSTAVETGTATEADLTRLEFRLFASGSGFLIVEDRAIQASVVQALGDMGRSLAEIDFAFDLDAFALDRRTGLLAFDNDIGGVALSASGEAVLDASGDGDAISVTAWNEGIDQGGWSGATSSLTTLPLPAALPALAAGLGALGLVARRAPLQARRRRVSA